MSQLVLPVIPSTSPTLAETMRACRLRAGLLRATGSAGYVLGNPKAWLGTAYHEVLEKFACLESIVDVEAAAVQFWDRAVDAQHQRAAAHQLNRRFGSPETWPGYHLVRASALLRAREVSAGGTALGATGSGDAGTIRERQFVAVGGKLVGRPDLIRHREVVDYKSGAIFEYDESSQSDVVKAAYVRQLRIYGFLVKEVLGWWPTRGVLLPFAGAGVEVPLEPKECMREAVEAVAVLDDYNSNITARALPEQLADPSATTCKWCSFKLVCTPLWSAVSPDWSGKLDGAVVDGVLDEPPRAIHGGAATSLTVNVQNGSEERKRVQLAPLNPNIHPEVTAVSRGDRVRLVGLRRRPDGSLVPTPLTVLARVDGLPAIVPASETEKGGTFSIS
ncbi:MAG: PD-(D/E)XK nuclease family protein [Nitrospira sp. BO4]|nr:PD-(D/E)XK nuclease family protein [Nitrospira sp. BO4]